MTLPGSRGSASGDWPDCGAHTDAVLALGSDNRDNKKPGDKESAPPIQIPIREHSVECSNPVFVPSNGNIGVVQNTLRDNNTGTWGGWTYVSPRGEPGTYSEYGGWSKTSEVKDGVPGFMLQFRSWNNQQVKFAIFTQLPNEKR